MNAPPIPPSVPQSEDYGSEVMCASWNPVVSAVAEPAGQAGRGWLADLPAVDIEGFLRQFYRCEGS